MTQLVVPHFIKHQLGKVFTQITVTNLADVLKAEDGIMPLEQVRSLTLDNVLVDPGATLLCLPDTLIQQLGLRSHRTVEVATAAGIKTTRIFRGGSLNILGREGIFDCLELPGGETVLLGVIPLETLGLEPDLQNQQLRVLPSTPEQTYLSML